MEQFTVLRISREDVACALTKGKELSHPMADNLSDGQMEWIASKVGDALAELGIWDIIAEVAGQLAEGSAYESSQDQ